MSGRSQPSTGDGNRHGLAAGLFLLIGLGALGAFLGLPAQPARQVGAMPYPLTVAHGPVEAEVEVEIEEADLIASRCPLHLPDRIAAVVCR